MALLVFEHSDLTGSDRLGEILRDYGQRLRVVRLHRDEPIPGDLDDIDGIITCGGPQEPTDDTLPWIEPQMELLRAADEAQMPVVGICLGCQILARALGGRVARMSNGVEFGWHEVSLNPLGREDPLHAGLAWESMQFHHHRFEVTDPPPGARVLASSAHCKIQTWARGLRTYGFQYHPEIHPETIQAWVDDEPEVLRESRVSREELRRQTEQHFPMFWRLAERLFESIALFLMPVDRRYHGLVKDLHH